MKEIRDEIFNSAADWNGDFMFPRTVLLHSMLSDCGYETRKTSNYHFDGMQRGRRACVAQTGGRGNKELPAAV